MMNKDWLDTKLGDIAKITCGIAATPEYVDESVGVPFLSARNVQDGKLDLSKFMYIPKELHIKLTKNTKPKKGDVLLTRVGAGIGKAAFVDIDFEFSVYVSLTLIQCKGMLDGNFLTFLLNTNYYQYLANRDQFAGGGVQNLNVQMVKGYPVSIPPLPEQIKIAEILSTWDNAINTVQKLLTNSQQQKKALMQQLLTGKKQFAGFEGEWEKVSLSAIFDKISNGLTYDPQAVEGLPVTRIETISTGKINYDKVGWAIDDKNTKRFTLEKGDILYSHINSLEHIGRVAFYQAEKPLYHGMNLLLLRAKSGVSKEFIFYVLNSFIGKKYAKTYAKSAVNQASISTTDIKSFKVFIPVLEEQQKIAAVLTTADQEIDNLRAQLNHLKQEKKALMQQLLTGKRRVKIEEAA
jgi:type I restriction enzyme S subunit